MSGFTVKSVHSNFEFRFHSIDPKTRSVHIPAIRIVANAQNNTRYTDCQIIKQTPDYLEYIVLYMVSLSDGLMSKKYIKTIIFVSETNEIKAHAESIPLPQWTDHIVGYKDLYQHPYNIPAHDHMILTDQTRAKYIGEYVWVCGNKDIFIKINENWVLYPKAYKHSYQNFMPIEVINELKLVEELNLV